MTDGALDSDVLQAGREYRARRAASLRPRRFAWIRATAAGLADRVGVLRRRTAATIRAAFHLTRTPAMPRPPSVSPDAPPLRPPPPWVEAHRYSLNVYAWEDHGEAVDLLRWLDDAEPTDDVRRKAGRVVLALVVPLLATSPTDPIGRRTRENLTAARAWVDGGPLDPATVAALDEATTRAALAAESAAADRPLPLDRDLARDAAFSAAARRAAMRLPLLAFAAASGPLAPLAYSLRVAFDDVGATLAPASLLAALRSEFPTPPAGYAEPRFPRRWNT